MKPSELLAIYRDRERMPGADHEAAWSRLQAAIRAEAGPVAAERRGPRRGSRWVAGLLVAAAIAVVVAGLRGWAGEDRSERGGLAVHTATADRTLRSTLRGAPRTAEPGAAAAPVVRPTPRPPVRAAGLEAELALLRGARAALADGNGDEALVSLAEHARRFPSGLLAEERTVLAVQALCALGRRDEARADAAAFVRRHPDSPHAATIAAGCED